MVKPVIGIISNQEYINNKNYKKSIISVNMDYVQMLINSNAIPMVIPYNIDLSDIERYIDKIDGLLLIGGGDISEKCYKLSLKEGNIRDVIEIEMYRKCKENKKPILGICRGMQIINVAENGTLKDINKQEVLHSIEEDGWINYHPIKINKGTILNKIFKLDEYVISSVHHQGIDSLGKNLIVGAIAEDGIIEEIESNDGVFVVGFQGHIEKCLVNFYKYKEVVDKFIKEASYGIR